MYIHPDAKLNGFKAVRIPKPAELFQILGPKQTNSHDGSDGSTWIEPENVNGVDNLDMIAKGQKELSAEAIRYAQASREANEPVSTDEPKQNQTAPATAD